VPPILGFPAGDVVAVDVDVDLEQAVSMPVSILLSNISARITNNNFFMVSQFLLKV
jgi:hypothetical protein